MAGDLTFVESSEWKATDEEGRNDLALVKAVSGDPEPIDAKAADGEDRVIAWTVSDEGVDRDGDIIRQAGWDLKNFRKNPVVMWAHQYREPPIGRATKVWIDKEGKSPRLRMLKQFTSQEENPFGYMIYNLAKSKFLRTASVGFIPREFEPQEEGRGLFFKKAELLESSVVPIPSNPRALDEAKGVAGIDLTPYVEWAEKLLDGEYGPGLWVPRAKVEEVFKMSRAETIIMAGASSVEDDTEAEPETETTKEADAEFVVEEPAFMVRVDSDSSVEDLKRGMIDAAIRAAEPQPEPAQTNLEEKGEEDDSDEIDLETLKVALADALGAGV